MAGNFEICENVLTEKRQAKEIGDIVKPNWSIVWIEIWTRKIYDLCKKKVLEKRQTNKRWLHNANNVEVALLVPD